MSKMILFLLFTVISLGHCCENIREPLCQTGIPYNSTVFPNLAGHLFQGGASVALRNLRSLIAGKCSPNIREFLCRVYMPECSSSGKAVMPSWEMCQEAYEGCAVSMSGLGMSWEFSLNCTRFQGSSIDAIKKIAQDKSAFWFGTGVTSLCSKPHATMACKMNSRQNIADSIISRLGGKVGVSSIDRLMEIYYNYQNGTFPSCGNLQSFPGGSFQVDPVSDKSHHPWEVQHPPRITWPSSGSQYYTLVMYDVGFAYLHGLYVNIPGNNITAADAVRPYIGFANPTDEANPYVYLLYLQNGRIQISDDMKNKLNQAPIQTITSNTAFSGPKAMSWVRIQQDPFSIERLNRAGLLNNCPLLVSKALRQHPEPFIPRDVKLEMSVDVFYSPKAITFTSCCKTYHYSETSFNLNPIGNMTVKTAHTRSTAVPTVTLIKRDLYPAATNFTGELYTLIMVDPDIPSRYGNPSHPYLHWMVLNIPDGNVNDGVTVREYKGPQPPSGVHTYYFLVYKQASMIQLSTVSNFTSNSCTRCSFEINKFVQDERLTLTGASWMLAKSDEYVRHIHVDESSTDIAAECVHQPHYPSACSSSILEEIVG